MMRQLLFFFIVLTVASTSASSPQSRELANCDGWVLVSTTVQHDTRPVMAPSSFSPQAYACYAQEHSRDQSTSYQLKGPYHELLAVSVSDFHGHPLYTTHLPDGRFLVISLSHELFQDGNHMNCRDVYYAAYLEHRDDAPGRPFRCHNLNQQERLPVAL